MFRLPSKYFSPDSPAGSGGSAPLSGSDPSKPLGGGPGGEDKDDVIKFLGDEKPEEEPLDLTPPKKKGKDADEAPDDDENLDEDDEDGDGEEPEDDEKELEDLLNETEEPTEEQLELMTPVRRKEILKKYPNLFKEFPYLEKAYYREQQFTEVFPTINDAKEARESKETLDKFGEELMGGNVETILRTVKEENGNSFYKIVDDLLPTLAKVDEGAYHHLLGNTIKHTIVAMVAEAKRQNNNETLLSAAQILNQFVFGNSEFSPPTRLSKEEKEQGKPDELSKREQDFNRRQFETVRNDLNTRVNNSLRATIEGNIDPRNSMTEYVKKQAVREATELLNKLFVQDKRFAEISDRLWKAAFQSNFSRESVERIQSAYRSKARTLLPSVIKKARNEALRGMGKRVKDEEETPTRRPSGDNDRPQSNKRGKIAKPGDIPKQMKTLDFLMQD